MLLSQAGDARLDEEMVVLVCELRNDLPWRSTHSRAPAVDKRPILAARGNQYRGLSTARFHGLGEEGSTANAWSEDRLNTGISLLIR